MLVVLLLMFGTGWSIPMESLGRVGVFSRLILENQGYISAPIVIAIAVYSIILVLTQTPSAIGLVISICLSGAIGLLADPLALILVRSLGLAPAGHSVHTASQTLLAMVLLLLYTEPRMHLRHPFDVAKPIGVIITIWSVLSVGLVAFAEVHAGVQNGVTVITSIPIVIIGVWVFAAAIGAFFTLGWKPLLRDTAFLVLGVTLCAVLLGGASPSWLQIGVVTFILIHLELLALHQFPRRG